MCKFARGGARTGVYSLRRTTFVFVGMLLLSPPLAAQPKMDQPPVFPTRQGLEEKWDGFDKKTPTPATLAAILKEDPDGALVVRWGDARYSSIRAAVERRILTEPKLIAELRTAH